MSTLAASSGVAREGFKVTCHMGASRFPVVEDIAATGEATSPCLLCWQGPYDGRGSHTVHRAMRRAMMAVEVVRCDEYFGTCIHWARPEEPQFVDASFMLLPALSVGEKVSTPGTKIRCGGY